MSDPRDRESPRPLGLALRLALYLVPGAVAAAVLWHDVLNEILAGRPMAATPWTALGMVALLGVSIVLLARFLGRGRGGG